MQSIASAATDSEVPPEVDQAINQGLAFLAHQQKPDGSFEVAGPRLAISGLALMSFLSAGHVPDEGRYGLTVRGAMEYLIHAQPADGYFGKLDGSRMYGQGIITLALAEAYGADHDPARRRAALAVVQKCVANIYAAQDVSKAPVFEGGWRYEPGSADSDLSLSGWNALALRAASNIGIDVPRERIGRALEFVERCYREDQGGFAYQPGQPSSVAMTSVGMLNLYLLEGPGGGQLQRGAKFLMAHPITGDLPMPYYSMYYASQAAFQAGGQIWLIVSRRTQHQLLNWQMPDGGWKQSPNGQEPGRIFATSMAVLSLTVPYRLLPVYQR